MIDLDRALSIASKAALKAGERIAEGLAGKMVYHTKTDRADRVTETDFEAQEIIQTMLEKEFPEIGFIGEEDPKFDTREGKEGKKLSEPDSSLRWIVDPLDGTMNFTHRMPFCGVSIGLEQEGKIILGVIHFPVFGWTYAATKGGGAKKNGTPIHVSDCSKFEDAMIAELFSDREQRGTTVPYPPVAAFRKFGSAITSLAFLAEGMIDGTAIRCRPWDAAAGTIIIEEAGGIVTILKDDPKDPRTAITCVASTPKIHDDLIAFGNISLGFSS